MTPLPPGASLSDFLREKKSADKRVFTTSRSAAVTYQRCPRRRYLGYHYGGTGITKTKLEAPLATGGYTHVALAALLHGKSAIDAAGEASDLYIAECKSRGLDLESTENQSQVAAEQVNLVVAFAHLAHRRILPALRAEYEILDVEREEWFVLYEDAALCLVMEARCDAILRERTNPTGDLYILSWKTAATWDRRKATEAKTDMQGLSEAYAVELRVGQPVLGTKMVHLLKGRRKEYPDDSGNYIQSSPLIHAWMNSTGPTPQFAWTYNWPDPDQLNDWGRPVQHRLGRGWKHCFIPDVMPVAEWIQMLDEGQVQPDAGDCLERQYISPMPEARSPEQKQRWLRQIEAQESAVIDYNEAGEEDTLDALFPQYTHSCNYPSKCSFWEICHGSEEVDNPFTLYQVREPHHPGESMLVTED